MECVSEGILFMTTFYWLELQCNKNLGEFKLG